MKIPFKKFYFEWYKPIIIFTFLMGIRNIFYFLFEVIYKGVNFISFSYYYNKPGIKYEVWYMAFLGPSRLITASLMLVWTSSQNMKGRYFLILYVLLAILIALDIIYIIIQYSIHTHPFYSSFYIAPYIEFCVRSIFTNLTQIIVLTVHLLKISGLLKDFSHYTYDSPEYYDKWIRSTWFPLLLLGSTNTFRFLIIYIYGSSSNGMATFKVIFMDEIENHSGKFLAVAVNGPTFLISGYLCYFLTRGQKVKNVLIAFILCFLFQFIGFSMDLRALVMAVAYDAQLKYNGNWNVSWALFDTLYTGTISALITVMLGLFYGFLKEESNKEINVLRKNEFEDLLVAEDEINSPNRNSNMYKIN